MEGIKERPLIKFVPGRFGLSIVQEAGCRHSASTIIPKHLEVSSCPGIDPLCLHDKFNQTCGNWQVQQLFTYALVVIQNLMPCPVLNFSGKPKQGKCGFSFKWCWVPSSFRFLLVVKQYQIGIHSRSVLWKWACLDLKHHMTLCLLLRLSVYFFVRCFCTASLLPLLYY